MKILIQTILISSIFIVIVKINLLLYQNKGLDDKVLKNIRPIKIFGKNSDWVDKNVVSFSRLFFIGFILGFIIFLVEIFFD